MCSLCYFSCRSKIGLGQHERHRHPDHRNEKRKEVLKGRGRVADKGGRSNYVWTDESTGWLRQLSETHKNDDSPLDSIMEGLSNGNVVMTRRQVQDKLRRLAIAIDEEEGWRGKGKESSRRARNC